MYVFEDVGSYPAPCWPVFENAYFTEEESCLTNVECYVDGVIQSGGKSDLYVFERAGILWASCGHLFGNACLAEEDCFLVHEEC